MTKIKEAKRIAEGYLEFYKAGFTDGYYYKNKTRKKLTLKILKDEFERRFISFTKKK